MCLKIGLVRDKPLKIARKRQNKIISGFRFQSEKIRKVWGVWIILTILKLDNRDKWKVLIRFYTD